jgi:D-glycero-alpha-D-manno-heptose 1-phosphate guanylyltransferase
MEAIILAGGQGTRLQSVVKDVPKCLAPISNKPFLHYLLLQLQANEFSHVILSVGYLKEQIIEFINNHKHNYSLKISFAIEQEPLGTGGGIQLALQQCNTTHAIVINGDTFLNFKINNLARHSDGFDTTIYLFKMQNFDRYGTVIFNEENGEVQAFLEKQALANGCINAGIYKINKQKFLNLNLPAKFSFEKDYLENFKNLSINLGAHLAYANYFIDIGVPADYNKAQTEIPLLFTN